MIGSWRMPSLAVVLVLLTTVVPAGFVRLLAKTANFGQIVCEHPEPFVYCAVKGDAGFDISIDRDRFGAFCPAVPQLESLRYPYVIRPTVQWVPVVRGRQVCWSVGLFQRMETTGTRSWDSHLRPVSVLSRKCTRSGNDHIDATPLDELMVEGEGPLYLSVQQEGAEDPIEVLAVYLEVRAVYR